MQHRIHHVQHNVRLLDEVLGHLSNCQFLTAHRADG
jgi:hypothetical protein